MKRGRGDDGEGLDSAKAFGVEQSRGEDIALEGAILSLLEERGRGKTICPSEAARLVRQFNWRPLMPQARAAAHRLAKRGEIVVLKSGEAVDALHTKGPIRLRKV